jgi:hypothetical protein
MLFVSCQPIMLKLYGIKDPDVENAKSITKHANKYNLDSENIVTLNSSDFLETLSKFGIPEGSIFDKEGRYIEYRSADTSCNAGLFDFIPALKLNQPYQQPHHSTLAEEISKYRDINGGILAPLPAADFYLFLYYTVWSGKLNKDHVKIWEDLARANKNCHIHVVKVNLDIQEHWPEADRKKIMKALEKANKK